jgi:hypothetical protein
MFVLLKTLDTTLLRKHMTIAGSVFGLRKLAAGIGFV